MVANQLYELCEAVGPDCTKYVPCGFFLIILARYRLSFS